MIFVIYQALFDNGKSYIGFTSNLSRLASNKIKSAKGYSLYKETI